MSPGVLAAFGTRDRGAHLGDSRRAAGSAGQHGLQDGTRRDVGQGIGVVLQRVDRHHALQVEARGEGGQQPHVFDEVIAGKAHEPTTSSCRYTIWCGLSSVSPASVYWPMTR